jgi:ribosomal protein L29
MSIPQFTDIISLSNTEISEAIIETENELFSLRFKKATRQTFKSHEIKYAKRRLAQLKTLLTMRLKELDSNEKDVLNNFITN